VTPPPPEYSTHPASLYPCTQPGYYKQDCHRFWVCKEVGAGVLSADRLFRCPDRYLFDPATRLCQREEKVEACYDPPTFYSALDLFTVRLAESDLASFFQQRLEAGGAAGRTGLPRPILPYYQSLYPYPVYRGGHYPVVQYYA